uniref:Secreted protein n=1 Tax=Ixodes ricinus TaxID=34613 RepID=A0A6B0UZA2_IXORI
MICLRMTTMRLLSHWFLLLRSNTSSISRSMILRGMLSWVSMSIPAPTLPLPSRNASTGDAFGRLRSTLMMPSRRPSNRFSGAFFTMFPMLRTDDLSGLTREPTVLENCFFSFSYRPGSRKCSIISRRPRLAESTSTCRMRWRNSFSWHCLCSRNWRLRLLKVFLPGNGSLDNFGNFSRMRM